MFYLITLAALLAACSSSNPRNSSPPPPAPTAFQKIGAYEPLPGLKMERYKHTSSGIDVVLYPKKGSDVVAFVVGYNVGSRYEQAGRTGLAHLFEHMMFRGTESFPEPNKVLAKWGGDSNAFTSFDHTIYYELVPKSSFEEAAHFEADRMRKLMITHEGYNVERGAVVSERKLRYDDNPWGRLNWESYQLSFQKHPYKTTPIGWQDDLDATSYEEALAFYNKFYAPNRAVISLVGDFEIPEALAILEKYFGHLKAEPWSEPQYPIEPPMKKHLRNVIPMKVETVYFKESIFSKSVKDPDAAVDVLLCTLLADSSGSYLYNQLVQTNIAQEIGQSCEPGVDPGLSAIFVQAMPGVSVKKLEQAYDASKKGFLKWIAQNNRVEKAKVQFEAGQYTAMKSHTHLATDFAESTIDAGTPTYSYVLISALQKVKLEDVARRYKDWLGYSTRVILEPSKVHTPLKKGRT